MTRAFDAISSISVIADDQLLYSTGQSQKFNHEVAGAYYQNVLDKPDKIFWSNLGSSIFFTESGERTEVLAAYGAIKGDDGSVIGLLVVEFLPNSFNNLLLQNQEILNYQYTFMVDRNDRIICADINGYPSYCSMIEKKFNEGTRRFVFEWNGEQYYACGQYNGLTGWKTFSVISVRNLFADADALREHIEILLIGAVSFMLLAIFLMYHSITRPLNDLGRAMRSQILLPRGVRRRIGGLQSVPDSRIRFSGSEETTSTVMDSAVPHWPAPVSVVTPLRPCSLA